MDPRPSVNRVYMASDSSTLSVEFTANMMLSTGWQKSDFNMYITGPHEPYEFTWSLRDSNNLTVNASDTFVFDLEVVDQFLGYEHEEVHVQFLNDRYFRQETEELRLLDWDVYTYPAQYASRQDDQCELYYFTYIFWSIFGLMFIVALFYCYKYMHSMAP